MLEEIVHIPQFTPLGVVTSMGDRLHPDFTDAASSPAGSGHRIPDFSIDGRNHAADGTLSPVCPDIAPFAVSQVEAQTDLINAHNSLKHNIVRRANRVCHADGSNRVFGSCTPGPAPLPGFVEGPCAAQETACFLGLDLSAPVLRTTAQPAQVHLPQAAEDRGPFAQLFSVDEDAQLQAAVADIRNRIAELPPGQALHMPQSIGRGSHTYGSMAQPRITQVPDGGGPLSMHNGARVQGAGILTIPRAGLLRNVTLHWQGIVLILDDGDLRATCPSVCGHIMGALVILDDSVSDWKLDFDRVTCSSSCSPLAVNYCCEPVMRALTLLQRTLSWTEQFDA